MIGYEKEGVYYNGYGNKIKCFKCSENKCIGTKSFPLQFGGSGELVHCANHEADAKLEVDKRFGRVTDLNVQSSNT